MHFLANQKQASLESPQRFSIPLVINYATKTSHASILFDSISCSFSESARMAGWHCYVNCPYNPTSPNFIIKMMCEIKSHNGTIMALGEICFFPNVTLRGYPCSGTGSVPTRELRYERIVDARSLVWECKISTAEGFSRGKAKIFTHANLSLRELTSIKKYTQRKSNTIIRWNREIKGLFTWRWGTPSRWG